MRLFYHVKTLYQYRELLWLWTLREIRARYKQSILGGLWAIFQPLFLMVVFNVIFSNFLRVSTNGVPYPIFSYSALLFWTFFSSSLSFGTNSLINNSNLVKKIYFPREILPLAAIGAGFIDFLIASTIFIGMMIYYRMPITVSMIWIGPLLLLQIILAFGVVLFSSTLNVFYRDLRFVVPLGIQVWMYATPIIYPSSAIPETWRSYLVILNPMLGVIEGYRAAILHGIAPDWALIGPGAVTAILTSAAGYIFFKRVELAFADVI